LTGIERRLNELQKQQVEDLKAKMNDWRDVVDRLNREMEGESKSFAHILLSLLTLNFVPGLSLIRFSCFAVSEAFPESQDLVINAVNEARKDLTGPQEPYWSIVEDHMVAMSARVSHMKVPGVDVLEVAMKAFDALYPTEPRRKTQGTSGALRAA
jgi:hypothetical protein